MSGGWSGGDNGEGRGIPVPPRGEFAGYVGVCTAFKKGARIRASEGSLPPNGRPNEFLTVLVEGGGA